MKNQIKSATHQGAAEMGWLCVLSTCAEGVWSKEFEEVELDMMS